MERVINKLKEIKKSLNELKSKPHTTGEDAFESYRDIIKRIIDRTYPEKDAKELKERLVHKNWVISSSTLEDEKYWQNFYLEKINLSIQVIDTILQEYELFGFEDFKPVKEKIETEASVKTGIFGFKRKKTREK